MKKIILLLCMISCFLTFSDVTGKRIQVSGISKKEIAPNSAKVTVTILTENENLDKASQENSEILEKYKNLLGQLNTKYEKINSSSYSTYKNYEWETEVLNKGQKEYKTTLYIESVNINFNIIKDFFSILSAEKVYSMNKNGQGVNIFEIITQEKTSKEAYQKALNKFNTLEQKLNSRGIRNAIKISGFNNEEVNLEKTKQTKKEINVVSHTLEVSTRDMKNIGNIIKAAHALNIGTNGYIEYDIDNKQQLEDELYENAYKEALKKAQIILGKTDLKLKKPVTVTDKSYNVIRPYSDYNYSNYRSTNYDKEIIKKSNKELMDSVLENNIIITPTKLNISKSVYIEFEMD